MKEILFGPSPKWRPLSGRGKLVFQWLPEKKGSILDIGCGDCFITRHFPKKCDKVYGLDISYDHIHLASGWYPELHLVKGSMENIPFRNSSFDIVTAIEVLEHTEDDASAIAEVERVLKPGGTLILTVPHRGFFYLLYPASLRKNFPVFYRMYKWLTDSRGRGPEPNFKEHRHYSVDQITNLLRDRFKVVKVETRGLAISEVLYLMMINFFRYRNFITAFLQKMIDLDIMLKYGRYGSLLIIKAVKNT